MVTRLANSRRARGGYTAEQILREILWAMEIPCDKGNFKVDGYRPDVAVPSNEALKRNPKKSVAIAVKRTLRERWAEDIDVFRAFQNGKFVLLLPDPDLKPSKMKDMVTRGMKEVYINDELYAKNKEIFPIEFRRHSELEADILKIIGIIQKKL